MKAKKRTVKARPPDQEGLTFNYYENLGSIISDLEHLDKLIPTESSRTGCLLAKHGEGEAAAIIEHRKDTLLRYIQLICRDHILWGNKLLKQGWAAKGVTTHLRRNR